LTKFVVKTIPKCFIREDPVRGVRGLLGTTLAVAFHLEAVDQISVREIRNPEEVSVEDPVDISKTDEADSIADTEAEEEVSGSLLMTSAVLR
jgi:hypothetical protein